MLTFSGKDYFSVYFIESTNTNVDIEIGVNADLQWISRRGGNFSTLSRESNTDDAFSWLVALELNCNEVYSSLHHNLLSIENDLHAKGLNTKAVIDSFPIENIILCGLKTMANNWTNLALDWLNDCVKEKAFAKHLLEVIVDNKKITQSVRHKARGILRQLSR